MEKDLKKTNYFKMVYVDPLSIKRAFYVIVLCSVLSKVWLECVKSTHSSLQNLWLCGEKLTTWMLIVFFEEGMKTCWFQRFLTVESLLFRWKHNLNQVISYILLNLHGDCRKYQLKIAREWSEIPKTSGGRYKGYLEWVIRISTKIKTQRNHRGEGWERKLDTQELIFHPCGGVFRLSCFTAFSPMSLLLFSTMNGGQLKANFPHSLGFLGEHFPSSDKYKLFLFLLEWITVVMTGLAAAIMGAWRKDQEVMEVMALSPPASGPWLVSACLQLSCCRANSKLVFT